MSVAVEPEGEKKDTRLVYGVIEAGALLGLSKNASYLAARRGQIPTIKIGSKIRVPKAALHAMLDGAGVK